MLFLQKFSLNTWTLNKHRIISDPNIKGPKKRKQLDRPTLCIVCEQQEKPKRPTLPLQRHLLDPTARNLAWDESQPDPIPTRRPRSGGHNSCVHPKLTKPRTPERKITRDRSYKTLRLHRRLTQLRFEFQGFAALPCSEGRISASGAVPRVRP